MKKLYILLFAVVLTACKTEFKNLELKQRVNDYIVEEKLFSWLHEDFTISPTSIDETIFNLNDDQSISDTVYNAYEFANGKLTTIKNRRRNSDKLKIYGYKPHMKPLSYEERVPEGNQIMKIEVEYDEKGLLKRLSSYVSGELDQVFDYSFSATDNVFEGTDKEGYRETFSFEVASDSLLVIIQKYFLNDGYLRSKQIRTVNSKNEEINLYYEENSRSGTQLVSKIATKYDTYGNLASRISLDIPSKGDDFYKYIYDEKGNWTERYFYRDELLLQKYVRKITY